MFEMFERYAPQPLIGAVTLALALLTLIVSYAVDGASVLHVGTIVGALLTPCLIVAVVLAYQFPIYIWHKTKVCVFTVPLFLMAAFLTPVLAATTAGLAILTAEMAVRTQRGNK